jgi:hypothetical protein
MPSNSVLTLGTFRRAWIRFAFARKIRFANVLYRHSTYLNTFSNRPRHLFRGILFAVKIVYDSQNEAMATRAFPHYALAHIALHCVTDALWYTSTLRLFGFLLRHSVEPFVEFSFEYFQPLRGNLLHLLVIYHLRKYVDNGGFFRRGNEHK